jgi:hypothetical protein
MPVKTPTILLRLELILSALAALSAIGFAVVALQGQHFFMLAGEGLILVAGLFGVLAGLGRFALGPAMAAACVAGSIAVGAGVGGLETSVLPSFRGERVETIATLSRVGIAGLILAIAGLMILVRRPGMSVKRVAIGALALAPVLAIAVAWRTGALAALAAAVPAVFFKIGVLAAGLVSIILLSIAIHCFIRAFEIGVDAADPQTPDPADNPSGPEATPATS